jgi:hypothetical protein
MLNRSGESRIFTFFLNLEEKLSAFSIERDVRYGNIVIWEHYCFEGHSFYI